MQIYKCAIVDVPKLALLNKQLIDDKKTIILCAATNFQI